MRINISIIKDVNKDKQRLWGWRRSWRPRRSGRATKRPMRRNAKLIAAKPMDAGDGKPSFQDALSRGDSAWPVAHGDGLGQGPAKSLENGLQAVVGLFCREQVNVHGQAARVD